MTKTIAALERAPDSNVVALTPSVEPNPTPPATTPSVAPPATTKDSRTIDEDDLESDLVINGVRVNLPLLFTILSYRRGHDSRGEDAFIREVLVPELDKTGYKWSFVGPSMTVTSPTTGTTAMNGYAKELQNPVLVVPNADGSPSETMFSCHIDTVHTSYSQEIRQKLAIDKNFGHVFLANDDKVNNCLGADNGAGVWLLLEMIRFKVPGTYVFHRGEERGCLGSKWLATHRKEWAEKYKRAIAFDRKDTNEVITTQRGMRTCSDKFAMELATALSLHKDLTYKPSPNGMYTDTASYDHIIPECTNVGVGYENAHGASESLDFAHVQNLLAACVALKWETLPTERDPKVRSYGNSNQYNSYPGRTGYVGGRWSSDDEDMSHWTGRQGSFNGFGHEGSGHRTGGYNGSTVHSPSPSPAPAANHQKQQPAVHGKGKKGKKEQTRAPLPTTSLVYGVSADDFKGSTFEELVAYFETLSADEASMVTLSLLEEIEVLNARLAFARAQLGIFNP